MENASLIIGLTSRADGMNRGKARAQIDAMIENLCLVWRSQNCLRR
ncbi:hypothetical protein GFS31_33610 [Leptolyngbya sp. BL0902]|nr:hypothetical protein GFS31_33610 [Leptolyngbya sp. BL0902]